jgi:DNA-binding transcriptional ArsR family regulator
MVKFQDTALDRTFAALSDPTRRALVMRLAAEPDLSVSELAGPFSMSLPAVMKHLDVLSDAGLVARNKTGRVVACRLHAEPMRDAFEWLNAYEKFWSERLSSLAAFLEEDESCPPKPPSNPASRLNAASRRRPPRSSLPGSTRKK